MAYISRRNTNTRDLSVILVCEEEKLSESQMLVYKNWEKKVQEYNALMRKHKEEEEKYQKAVKAVDTGIGLKTTEKAPNANGITKFLRSVSKPGDQLPQTQSRAQVTVTSGGTAGGMITNKAVSTPVHQQKSVHTMYKVPPYNQQGLVPQQRNTTATLTSRPQATVHVNGSNFVRHLPGQTGQPSSFVQQSGASGIRSSGFIVQTRPNPTGAVSRPTPTLPNAMGSGTNQTSIILNRYTGKTVSVLPHPASKDQGTIQLASKGQKRPTDGTAEHENKRLKQVDQLDAKMVMKHYGYKKGKKVVEEGSRRFKIKCFHCNETMASNVLYAEHVKKILESKRLEPTSLSAMVICPRCYKRFRTPFEMQEHLERSHVKGSIYQCFTCELSFDSEARLTKHMTMFHPILQMPFSCNICQYRTSAYADITDHFATKHEGFKALMCPYCLRMLRCSKTFLGHCQKHISLTMRLQGGNFPCKNCKLTFLSSAERNEHMERDHKKYDVKDRDGVPKNVKEALKNPGSYVPGGSTSVVPQQQSTAPKIKLNLPIPKSTQKSETKYVFTQHSKMTKPLPCMECGQHFQNFGMHFSRSIKCELCAYTTFCVKSIATHMIIFHREGRTAPKLCKVSKQVHANHTMSLTCRSCAYRTDAPSEMAHHVAKVCPKRVPIEWISYLSTVTSSANRTPTKTPPSSAQSSTADNPVIVLDSDED